MVVCCLGVVVGFVGVIHFFSPERCGVRVAVVTRVLMNLQAISSLAMLGWVLEA